MVFLGNSIDDINPEGAVKSIGKKSLILMVMLCCLGFSESNPGDGQSKIRIGVLSLDVTGMDAAGAAQAQDQIVGVLTDLGFYKVYKQTDLEHAFESIKQRFPAHCRDPRCVAAIGSALGLDRMVYGSLDKNRDRYGIALSLLDVQTMQISQHVTMETEGSAAVADLVKAAVYKVHGLSDGKANLKTHAYFGPDVHHERQLLYSSAAFVALSAVWAAANGTLKNFHNDHSLDTITWSGKPSSSLQIPLFGRPAGLADNYVAASDDAYGVMYNPAGMAWVKNLDVAIGYQYNHNLINNFVGSYATKATRDMGFGQAIYYNADYTGLQSELYFISAYAYKFNQLLPFLRPLSVGASLKVININTPKRDLSTVSQNTLGAGLDLGLMTEFSDNIRFGFVFKDCPTFLKVSKDDNATQDIESSPPLLQVGGTYQAGYSTFLICEGQIPLNPDQVWKFAGGIEQEFFQVFLARLGLKKEVSFDSPWAITAGFGTRFNIESIVGKYFILDGAYEYNTLYSMFSGANVSFRVGF
jgi:hypothetical protein